MKALIMALLICCFGCSAAKTETPQRGARAIGDLLKARDYSTLFQERYCEWYKVEAQGMAPDAAIKKLSARHETQHDLLVALFDQLSAAEFTLSRSDTPQETETGDVATATVTLEGRDIPSRLYKMKNGRWGFHL